MLARASLLLLRHGGLCGSKLDIEKEIHHDQHHQIHIALSLVFAAAVLTSTAEAEIHSRSKDLVVMEARDLPEQAQTPGNSLFFHSDNAGSTYLYVDLGTLQGE